MRVEEANDTQEQVLDNGLMEKLQMLEKYLNELEDQLVRAQRLASLGTMATMIAHEFNNILTPVVSYAQYALGRDDTDLMRKALDKAFTNGREAAEVCQLLLNFGRGESEGSTSLVSETVKTTIRCLVRNPAKDNIDLQINIPDESLVVKIESCLLQQVIYNMLLNARDAILGRQGRISISAQNTSDNQIRIDISDNGPGVDPAIQEKIFNPFFTTKSKSKSASKSSQSGSGLGLAVSKHIIEKAGGKITLQSEPGKGTTFSIFLPKA
jgi:signal transduction histidine kinase